MQFIPLQAAAGDKLLDMQALFNNYTEFMFRGWSGSSRSLHLDGLSVFDPRHDGSTRAYTMVFRSGAFEAVRSAAAQNAEGSERIIPGTTIATLVQEAVARFLTQSARLGYSGPAAFGTVLADLGEYRLGYQGGPLAAADRSHLVLPDIWVERLEDVPRQEEVWRPIVDMLWQCFDLERCAEFDERHRAR